MSAPFEADLCPETGAPRIRFNFENGWSASIVLRGATSNGCDFLMASLARCPTGQWGQGKTHIIGNELSPDEVAHWLVDTDMRRAPPKSARAFADEVTQGAADPHTATVVLEEPEVAAACTLSACPPGLFWYDGILGFKSEYHTPDGSPEAYVVESGEFFAGGATTRANRNGLIVQPLTIVLPKTGASHG